MKVRRWPHVGQNRVSDISWGVEEASRGAHLREDLLLIIIAVVTMSAEAVMSPGPIAGGIPSHAGIARARCGNV